MVRRPRDIRDEVEKVAASIRLSSVGKPLLSTILTPPVTVREEERLRCSEPTTPVHLVRAPMFGAPLETAHGRYVCQPHPGVCQPGGRSPPPRPGESAGVSVPSPPSMH